MSGKKKDDWRWPEEPIETDAARRAQVKAITSPYGWHPPPFCYPGTQLSDDITELAAHLLPLQINNIGTHTHAEAPERGFEAADRMERETIYMIADALSNHDGVAPIDVPERVEGYFCGGGTEANDMGLWVGREFLGRHPDPMGRGIAVLCTPLTHYSVHKATAKLGIGQSKWSACPSCGKAHIFTPDPSGAGVTLVGMNENGSMHVGAPLEEKEPDVDFGELQRVFRLKYDEGFRRFIIVPTVGTTEFGSIDDVARIAKFVREFVRRTTSAQCYIHVDAAIGGFTVPFAGNPGDSWPSFGFDIPEVMSVTVDGDKMGRLPYPAGIFLCRKHLQRLVDRQVPYIGSHHDDTFSGSRTCVAPVLAWYLFGRGRKDQREYVRACIKARDDLATELEAPRFKGWVTVRPHSPFVNILPVELRIDPVSGEVPEALLREHAVLVPYVLRSDGFQKDPRDPQSCTASTYKLSIWPHTIPYVPQFIADLIRAKEEWDRRPT
ncbi:hypothetical protein HY635_04150 [Candidatus Uhrbacteria bacterium]|nr:hypothetical protein [Candidatus Uhrbacteria bacterium]